MEKQSFASRLFGFDVFISFALGPPPRGTQSYASDLARRLRERDFAVFFSEQEAPPGEPLTSTLRGALHRSKTLVVVANRPTLAAPRWVRQEVEEFRTIRPARPVIPINVDNALRDLAGTEAARAWLGSTDTIWLDETAAAVENGIATDALVERLVTSPMRARANVRWRWLVRATAVILLLLTAATLLAARDARRQAVIAETNADEAKRQEKHSRQLLYVANVNLALRAHDDGNFGLTHRLLDTLRAQAQQSNPVPAEFAWRYLWRVSHPLVSRQQRPVSIAVSPGGDLIAFGSGSTVQLMDARTHRSLATLLGHSTDVTSVVFSPDGRTLASASGLLSGYVLRNEQSEIKLWDASSKREVASWKGHTIGVASLAFSPDGKTLASGSADSSVKVWSVSDRRELATPRHHTTVEGMAFSHDGKLFASADDKFIRTWNVADWSERSKMQQPGPVDTVAFSPDDRTLATGMAGAGADKGNPVWLWDVERAERTAELNGLHNRIAAVAFHKDGRTLAAASDDYTIGVWDLMELTRLAVLRGHSTGVGSIAFTPDGRELVSAGDDTIRFWQVESWSGVDVFHAHEGHVSGLAFSPDSTILASASWDKTVKLWTAHSRKLVAVLGAHDDIVADLAFSPDGKSLATASWDHTIKLWDITDREHSRLSGTLEGHTKEVISVSFTPDGKSLVSAGWDGTLRLWSVASRQLLRTVTAQPHRIQSFDLSRDGKVAASDGFINPPGEVSEEGIRLWHVPELTPICTLRRRSLAGFSRDGRLLTHTVGHMTSGRVGDRLSFWNVQRDAADLEFADSGNPVAFSRDGQTLASGQLDQIKLWHVPSGTELITLTRDLRNIESIAFSPDGRALAAGYSDGHIGLRRAASDQDVEAALHDLQIEKTNAQAHARREPDQRCERD